MGRLGALDGAMRELRVLESELLAVRRQLLALQPAPAEVVEPPPVRTPKTNSSRKPKTRRSVSRRRKR
jgi:hypothetical protein